MTQSVVADVSELLGLTRTATLILSVLLIPTTARKVGRTNGAAVSLLARAAEADDIATRAVSPQLRIYYAPYGSPDAKIKTRSS